MHSFLQGSTSSVHPNPSNAFTASFLGRLAERDEPPTSGDADVAGPWRVEPLPGSGFGLFRLGETLARGFAPAAVFPSRWLALLGAAILPGTGQDPLLLLSKQESLSYLLEAAGAVALERCGAILDERLGRAEEAG